MSASSEHKPNAETIEEALQLAAESLISGVSLAQQGKISADEVEALYALGSNYYFQKNFVKAEEIFSYALPFDFFHFNIVSGLAAARKMQGKYEEALKAYALAGLLDMENPEPSLYAAECFFALDKLPECAGALDAAFGLTENQSRYESLRTKIKKMKNALPKTTQNKRR